MATSPVPLWAQEMSAQHRGPTARGVLLLAVLAVLVALWLQAASTTPATTKGGGRVDSPACAEVERLEQHGVAEGASYQRAVAGCYGGAAGR